MLNVTEDEASVDDTVRFVPDTPRYAPAPYICALLKAFVPSDVVVAVPPFAVGMIPVRENVVEPLDIVEVIFPEPESVKAVPVYPFIVGLLPEPEHEPEMIVPFEFVPIQLADLTLSSVMSPLTSSAVAGVVVPMPTLPAIRVPE